MSQSSRGCCRRRGVIPCGEVSAEQGLCFGYSP
jgi:hypothetical protein